jgi:hypothetical protein
VMERAETVIILRIVDTSLGLWFNANL